MTTARSSGAEGGPPRRSARSSRPRPSRTTAASSSTSSSRGVDPVVAGRVGRAHGLDGSFYVTRPVTPLLVVGQEVTLSGTVRAIDRRAGTDKRPIVRVAGIGDRDAAEALRGEDLLVVPLEAPELGEGEWWAHELEGCAVLDGTRPVGQVLELRGLPSVDVLVVERTEGGELLVPLVGDAVRSVDTDARRIDIDLRFLEGSEA